MRNMMVGLLALVSMAPFQARAQSLAYEKNSKEMGKAARGSDGVEYQFEQPIIKQQTARSKENAFLSKTQAFAELWTALAREYNEKGTFNMKLAKEVSKAFHALEKSDGWPKVDRR